MLKNILFLLILSPVIAVSPTSSNTNNMWCKFRCSSLACRHDPVLAQTCQTRCPETSIMNCLKAAKSKNGPLPKKALPSNQLPGNGDDNKPLRSDFSENKNPWNSRNIILPHPPMKKDLPNTALPSKPDIEAEFNPYEEPTNYDTINKDRLIKKFENRDFSPKIYITADERNYLIYMRNKAQADPRLQRHEDIKKLLRLWKEFERKRTNEVRFTDDYQSGKLCNNKMTRICFDKLMTNQILSKDEIAHIKGIGLKIQSNSATYLGTLEHRVYKEWARINKK